MKCPKCGKENQPRAPFCKYCGEALFEQWGELPKDVEELFNEQDNAKNSHKEWKEVDPFSEVDGSEKKSYKGLVAWIVIAFVVMGITLYAGYRHVGNLYTAQAVAKSFFKARQNQNWGQAYQMLDLPSDPFLSGEMYAGVNVLKNEPTGYRQLTSKKAVKKNTYILSYYLIKGEKEYHDTYTMIPTGKRIFLGYKEWKVDGRPMLAKNVDFTIPRDATVRLNGKRVPQSRMEEEENHLLVTLPYLFQGRYQLEVSKEGMEPYRSIVYVGENGMSKRDYLLRAKSNQLEKVFKQGPEDVKKLAELTTEKVPYEQAKDIFSKEAIASGEAAQMYQSAQELFCQVDSQPIVSMQLTNLSSKVIGDPKADMIEVEVSGHLHKSYHLNEGEALAKKEKNIVLNLGYVHQDDGYRLQFFLVK